MNTTLRTCKMLRVHMYSIYIHLFLATCWLAQLPHFYTIADEHVVNDVIRLIVYWKRISFLFFVVCDYLSWVTLVSCFHLFILHFRTYTHTHTLARLHANMNTVPLCVLLLYFSHRFASFVHTFLPLYILLARLTLCSCLSCQWTKSLL